MTDKTRTFDNKRLISPITLKEIDQGFHGWFNDKLNMQLPDGAGNKKKVPVRFVAAERWKASRESGFRNEDGTLILPIIAITRTDIGSSNSGFTQRIFADTKQDHVYAKKYSIKTNNIKNLNELRAKNIDPSLPIHEVYTAPSPDWFEMTFVVDIWVQYVTDMNFIIESLGQHYDFKSMKSFCFYTRDGLRYEAFQDDDISDESNLADFSDTERLIRKSFTFKVPAYVIPETNTQRSPFKRYWSQTKLVFKEEIIEEGDLPK